MLQGKYGLMRTTRVILYIQLYVLMRKDTEDTEGHPLYSMLLAICCVNEDTKGHPSYSIICINEKEHRGHQGSSLILCYMY